MQAVIQEVEGVKGRMSAMETQVGGIAGGIDVQGLLRVQEEQRKSIQEMKNAKSTWGGQRKGGILESKVWAGVKTLTAERAQFKEWLGKLKNAYGQARPGTRMVFDSLERWRTHGTQKETMMRR